MTFSATSSIAIQTFPSCFAGQVVVIGQPLDVRLGMLFGNDELGGRDHLHQHRPLLAVLDVSPGDVDGEDDDRPREQPDHYFASQVVPSAVKALPLERTFGVDSDVYISF